MLRVGLAALALLGFGGAAVAASGDCGDMVAKFDAYLKSHPDATGALPQTVAAQKSRQPTRASVEEAQKQGRQHLLDLLAKAQEQEKAGDDKGCRATLVEIEWMIQP